MAEPTIKRQGSRPGLTPVCKPKRWTDGRGKCANSVPLHQLVTVIASEAIRNLWPICRPASKRPCMNGPQKQQWNILLARPLWSERKFMCLVCRSQGTSTAISLKTIILTTTIALVGYRTDLENNRLAPLCLNPLAPIGWGCACVDPERIWRKVSEQDDRKWQQDQDSGKRSQREFHKGISNFPLELY